MTLWRALERRDDLAVQRAGCALRAGLCALQRLHALQLVLCVSHANVAVTAEGRWKVCGAQLARELTQVEQERDLLGHRILPEAGEI